MCVFIIGIFIIICTFFKTGIDFRISHIQDKGSAPKPHPQLDLSVMEQFDRWKLKKKEYYSLKPYSRKPH